MKQQYNTALYLRLSRDDELKGESGSISTQRDMLTQYCREQNLNIIGEYVDDGWSGTNFDRPSFQRMIDDIEDGKIKEACCPPKPVPMEFPDGFEEMDAETVSKKRPPKTRRSAM